MWRHQFSYKFSGFCWFVRHSCSARLSGTLTWTSGEDTIAAPMTPEASLSRIRVPPGFKVELAAEPLVKDPIAFAWGADGKLWVVEMGDYPLGVDGKGKPGGRVKFLEDTDGDGRYDKATVFLDGLRLPDRRDALAQGRARRRAPRTSSTPRTPTATARPTSARSLFTGFAEGNQQHRVNGLVWGLDNWIYGANGDSGGTVKSVKTGKVVNIRGRDFRIRPDTGELEPESGQTQYGRSRDDWGNWFGSNNSNPALALRPRRPLPPPQPAPRRRPTRECQVLGHARRRAGLSRSAGRCRASTTPTRPTTSPRRAAPSSTATTCSARRSPATPSSASRSTTSSTARS